MRVRVHRLQGSKSEGGTPSVSDVEPGDVRELRFPCAKCGVGVGQMCRTLTLGGRVTRIHAARRYAAEYKRGSDGRLRVTGTACQCGFVPTVRVDVEAVLWAKRYALKGVMASHKAKHARKASRGRGAAVTLRNFGGTFA